MTPTGTEARVCQDIAERQQRGIEKYGTTVEANPLSKAEWRLHLYQELLDAVVYLKREMEMEESKPADGLTQVFEEIASVLRKPAAKAAEPKPLQVEAGKWYERRDGEIVGPMKPLVSDHPFYSWSIPGKAIAWSDRGRYYEDEQDAWDLIREVPPPMEKAEEPQYRPFASAAEFAPHRDRWICSGNGTRRRVEHYNEKGVNGMPWDILFRSRTFDDDGQPCGVRL